jgi:hypothetical protein
VHAPGPGLWLTRCLGGASVSGVGRSILNFDRVPVSGVAVGPLPYVGLPTAAAVTRTVILGPRAHAFCPALQVEQSASIAISFPVFRYDVPWAVRFAEISSYLSQSMSVLHIEN